MFRKVIKFMLLNYIWAKFRLKTAYNQTILNAVVCSDCSPFKHIWTICWCTWQHCSQHKHTVCDCDDDDDDPIIEHPHEHTEKRMLWRRRFTHAYETHTHTRICLRIGMNGPHESRTPGEAPTHTIIITHTLITTTTAHVSGNTVWSVPRCSARISWRCSCPVCARTVPYDWMFW